MVEEAKLAEYEKKLADNLFLNGGNPGKLDAEVLDQCTKANFVPDQEKNPNFWAWYSVAVLFEDSVVKTWGEDKKGEKGPKGGKGKGGKKETNKKELNEINTQPKPSGKGDLLMDLNDIFQGENPINNNTNTLDNMKHQRLFNISMLLLEQKSNKIQGKTLLLDFKDDQYLGKLVWRPLILAEYTSNNYEDAPHYIVRSVDGVYQDYELSEEFNTRLMRHIPFLFA